jgi:uncharacterized protein (TIGR02118 family)
MIKRVTILTRKPGLSREQFFEHWNNVTGPLLASHPNVLRSVQNNVTEFVRFTVRGGDPSDPAFQGLQAPDADGFVELWFESREKMEEMYSSPFAQQLVADGEEFVGTIATYVVEELIVVDRTADSTSPSS